MIFIDTGAFIARYLTGDQYHAKTIALWDKIIRNHEPCFTSSFVLDETITLLNRRAGYNFSADRADRFYASSHLEILRPQLQDEMKALSYFRKFADQSVSFTDCISFTLMVKKNMKRVFTFDRHFQYAGFTIYS